MADETTTVVDQLAAAEEVRRLMASYVRLADHKKFDEVAGLFTADGTMTPHDVAGAPLVTMRGRAEIQATITASVGSAQPIHHIFSSEVTIASPTAASGVWAMEDLVTYADLAPDAKYKSMHGYGHYHVEFVKNGDTWQISELQLTRLQIDITPMPNGDSR